MPSEQARPLRLCGDEEELFRRHNDRLVRTIRRRLDCAEAGAEDASALAWLQLYRTQPERTERLFGWLAVVAFHAGLRLLRERSDLAARRGDDLRSVPDKLEELVTEPVDVELALEAREALRALAGLGWRRRRVLALRAAGYSYKEIAEQLGVTYTNVNRHITEGRAELRGLRDAA